ncbi:hypothetical protein Droror1_Dr00012506 [Drosera rotundifolia]
MLDMCSSWVSHFPAGYKQERVVGLGLNEEELRRNRVLTEYVVQDLNVNPQLPFEDRSFDVIINVVGAGLSLVVDRRLVVGGLRGGCLVWWGGDWEGGGVVLVGDRVEMAVVAGG